jgi:hypothetical protein
MACETQAQTWSYDGLDPDELVGTGQADGLRYSVKPEHYLPRCYRCHKAHDGHRGETHSTARLTEEDIREIRRLYKIGLDDEHRRHTYNCALLGHFTSRVLAEKYGISPNYASDIARGRGWNHLDEVAA